MKPTVPALAIAILTVISSAQAQNPSPGDAGAGAVVFKRCMACHQVGPDAKNGVGPVLNGVVGRPAGTYPGYSYSAANKNSGLTWDEPTLTTYLRAPRKLVPGTKMTFAGLSKDQEIADVIAYLKQFNAEGQKVAP
ncbi:MULTISPECIES: cytochrome c family protein [Mesorhizobium]|uniref:Cytochrome c n=1 Tax=Mesorhizobium shonense TaxID=1209948 RepID=A0ABV2HVS4_9HYPH|nr:MULTISPECIES: cytochrome c family protein [unclassified Mesorhizobium]AZO28414.1 cytochrome c family protein [Mesorhizobium sp. M1B.F.Ca.ET.045.04.1.1]RWA66168.1 MAG: c-type cytochrome [Mesorhizobium sp.]TIS45557.1 MAG: c-type cytochrome [Mesorhizobium sp.]